MDRYLKSVLEFDKKYGIEKENLPTLENLIYNVLAMTGEAGEVANEAKKIWRDGWSQERMDSVAEELVDTVVYLMKVLIVTGIDFDKAWDIKFSKLQQVWDKKIQWSRKEDTSECIINQNGPSIDQKCLWTGTRSEKTE